MYFSKFPTVLYGDIEMIDLSKRFNLLAAIRNNISLFEPYRVKDGEKIEDIAYRLYGNTELHWVIMLMNDIIDPFYDWVLSPEELKEYAELKYNDINSVHHWEDSSGREVNSDFPAATLITNLEFETARNESNREIKLLKVEYLGKVLQEFDKLVLK